MVYRPGTGAVRPGQLRTYRAGGILLAARDRHPAGGHTVQLPPGPARTSCFQAYRRYLQQAGYTFNWIPYYGSRGYDVWQQFGFDQVYLQPNYYWKPQNDMDEVCRQIDSLGIGMEIEFEPTLLNAREGSGTFRKRLRDYIDYAKRRNIYGKRPFAYYHGTNGFYDLHASDDEADRELFDELCQFIINNPLRAQRPTTDRK